LVHEFGWYLKRISVMTLEEVVRRLLDAMRLKAWEVSFHPRVSGRGYLHIDPRAFRFCTDPAPQIPPVPFAFDTRRSEIESWLLGGWPALGFGWSWTPNARAWHQAPDTGRDWPRVFFGKVRYRQGNPFGDARVVWEPSRLQQLVTLALIARRHEDERARAVDLIVRQLLSWHEANPAACGVHYVSAMECGLRIIAVCFALDLIRSEIIGRPAVWQCAAAIVHSHADLIVRRLSLHSSSGNHTIAECAGLVFAGVLFPEMRGASRWYAVGLKTLRQEATRQVLPDGGGIERATWYHLFVLDLLGLVERLLAFKDHKTPQELTTALKRGRSFLATFAQSPADLPVFGDADSGFALSPFLSLSFDAPPAQERLRTFPDTGLTLAKLANGTGLTLIMDHGALGMPPSYGHGHADALSLILQDDAGPLLIDSGTYTYTGDQRWRNYFRGTRAHNTLLLDGRDQARPETPFMWSRPFIPELIEAEVLGNGQVRLLARHTGYRDLGVVHWRGVLFSPERLIVWDGMRGDGEHCFELNWHLGVEVSPESENSFALLTDRRGVEEERTPSGPLPVQEAERMNGLQPTRAMSPGDRRIRLLLRGGVTGLHHGETDPIRGWRSLVYGRKSAITTVSLLHRGPAPHEFLSVLSLTGADPAELDIEPVLEWFRRRAV
jgi:hypothetical protein